MNMIGYARVSTADQKLDAQLHALRAAGCTLIFEEHASGGDRSRKELAAAIAALKPGDTFVVTKLDRVGRNLGHLIETIDLLIKKGVAFRSLADSIDTSTASGRLVLHVMGAIAEFERGLIRDRTMEGLAAARRKGRVGGNPKMRARDKAALGHLHQQRRDAYRQRVLEGAAEWLPLVKMLRPDKSWEEVVVRLNRADGAARWTEKKIRSAAKAAVKQGLAPERILSRAAPKLRAESAMVIAATLARANPEIKLTEIARQLEMSNTLTANGKRRWYPTTVKNLLDQARGRGLLPMAG